MGLVNSILDSPEVIIQRTIEGIQRMISLRNNQGEEEKGRRTTTEPVIEISLTSKRHWELQIRTLQEAPRDADKLRKILKAKQKEYEKAEDSEDIERLVPETEMLKFVLFLVCRNLKNDNNNS
jgi:hypothetical protein